MHRPEIDYGIELPPEYKAAVEPLIAKWLWLAPSWVRTLDVHYDNSATEAAAWVTTNFDYRRATIYLTGGWLYEEDPEREYMLVHELCHLFSSPLVNWFQRYINRTTEDESLLAGELNDRLAEHVEGCTVDLSRALVEHRG